MKTKRNQLIIFIISCLAVGLTANAGRYPGNPSFVLEFENDSVNIDASNTADGTIYNGDGFVGSYDTNNGQALRFKATTYSGLSDTHVILPSLDVASMGEFTMGIAFRIDSLQHSHGTNIVGFGNVGIMFRYNKLYFTTVDGSNRVVIPWDSSWWGEWIHYAMTYDNGTLKAYMNGVLVGTATATGVYPDSSFSAIGAHHSQGYGYFSRINGRCDNFYFAEETLSVAEVVELSNL